MASYEKVLMHIRRMRGPPQEPRWAIEAQLGKEKIYNQRWVTVQRVVPSDQAYQLTVVPVVNPLGTCYREGRLQPTGLRWWWGADPPGTWLVVDIYHSRSPRGIRRKARLGAIFEVVPVAQQASVALDYLRVDGMRLKLVAAAEEGVQRVLSARWPRGEDPWYAVLAALSGPWVTTDEVRRAVGAESRADILRLGRIMRSLGWRRGTVWAGKAVWAWRR